MQRKAEILKNKKERLKRKKHFGKSIQSWAPALLLNIIDRKLKYAGSKLIKINTVKFKTSQYNHVTDNYKKSSLSNRNKTVESWKVQSSSPLYDRFCKAYDKCLIQKIKDNDTLPSNMEIKYFRKYFRNLIERI